ncbi:MAG: SRPBCC domain-containing protein, partial [Pseudomonadota bacterium]|nr:SRPBCC domain-containing protein [Pseudomonadota bacterium]
MADSPQAPPLEGFELTAQEMRKPVLPYSKWWPVVAGVLTGLALRLFFSGKPGAPYSAMMSSFVLLVPLLVGAVTVYVAETQSRHTWAYYAVAPILANILFVLSTMAIVIEGLICAILIAPLFALVGAIGGLIMGAVCRKTRWPRRAVYGVAILPFMLGGLEQHNPLTDRTRTIEHVRIINATPETIWRQLENANAITPDEVDRAWVYRIGVPIPKAGVTEATAEGMVRHITMGSGIHFDELAVEWQPNRHVRWANRLAPASFPPNALD